MSSSESHSQGLKTTLEILAYIHDCYLKDVVPNSRAVVWDCVLEPGIHHDARDKTRNEWVDAAYNGNWDALLRIAVRPGYNFVITRDFANSTRLRPKPDANGQNTLGWKPAGYTALHQAAWWGAPIEVVQGLIELGASRDIRTTDGKRQRPLDIAREKSHKHLYDILTPTGLPDISDDELSRIEAHFHKVILEESPSRGAFTPESMRLRLPDLGMLRDLPRVSMPVPGMLGGFHFWWSDGHLIMEASSRFGYSRTYHITAKGFTLVAQDN